MHDAGSLAVAAPKFGERGDIAGMEPAALVHGRIGAEQTGIDPVGEGSGIAFAIKPEPIVFVDDDRIVQRGLLRADSRPRRNRGEVGQEKRLAWLGFAVVPNPLKKIGVRLKRVGGPARQRPAVVPRPVRKIEMADSVARLAGFGRDAFILRIPDDHAGMVPALLHPRSVFGDELFRRRTLRA